MEKSSHGAYAIDLAKVVERRWHTMLICAALAALVALLYCLTAEKVYRSGVEIMVVKKDASATNVSGNQSSDMQKDVVEDVLATHIRLFGSPRVVQDAIAERGLDKLPGIADHVSDQMTAGEYILENLEVARGGEGQAKEAQVLSAEFSHTEPEEARVVLDALVQSYQEFLDETFNSVGAQALRLIKENRDLLGADLEAAELAYAKFRGEAPLMFSGDDSYSVYEREQIELSQMRSQLKVRRSTTQSRLDALRNATEGPGADSFTDAQRLALIDDEHVQRLSLLVNVERGDSISEAFQADQPARSEAAQAEFDKLVSLRTEAGLLKSKFGASHPRLDEVNSTISELEGFLKGRGIYEAPAPDKLEPREIIAAYVKMLENDLVHIDRTLVETDALIAEVATSAKSLDEFELKDAMLADGVERKRELYNAFIARISELDMATGFGGFETPVIKPVTVAKQVWPNLLICGAVAIALGLAGGFGVALWTELSDHTFQSADEVADAVGAPVLGVVPQLRGADGELESPLDGKLVALHRSQSTDAEAIRAVRTALFFASRGSDQCVVQFTSPTPSDGKSLISANVAISLAAVGKRVLLIDADLRKPTQHKLFGIGGDRLGLADLLIDHADLPDAVVAAGVDNLELLTAGSLPPNPAELLSMPRFGELIQSLREKYDYVVVDTPPVLIVSDPLNVASQADGVILVTPIKPNMAGAAVQAARMLEEVDANLLGAVVNDLEHRLVSAPGTGRYGQSYGYLGDASGYTSEAPTPARASAGAEG